MSLNIGTDAEPVLVFVRMTGGMLDAIVRATDASTFEAAARWAELKYEITETVTDPETGETSEDGTGEWVVSPGVNIDVIGPVQVGETWDNRYHVNIRIADPALSKVDEYGVLKWEKWAMAWTMGGEDDEQINRAEVGKVLYGVSLIDPDTISSPSRVWL